MLNKKYGFGKFSFTALKVLIVAFWGLFFAAFGINLANKKFFYPLIYKTEIFAAADNYGLEPEIIFGFAKTESGFRADAVSEKGAVGIMQITPSTAKYIAEKTGTYNYDLFDAETNINFGAYYIEYLFERFYSIKEVAAAYNAGEGTVRNWLKNREYSRDGITLYRIPFAETERYVDKICKAINKYRKLYGKLLDKRDFFE